MMYRAYLMPCATNYLYYVRSTTTTSLSIMTNPPPHADVLSFSSSAISICFIRPISSIRRGQAARRIRFTSAPGQRTTHRFSNTGTSGFSPSCPSTSTLVSSRSRCDRSLMTPDQTASSQQRFSRNSTRVKDEDGEHHGFVLVAWCRPACRCERRVRRAVSANPIPFVRASVAF